VRVTRRDWLGFTAGLCAWPAPCFAADRPDILVFAAASLTDAVLALADGFGKSSGITVRTSFAASSALARQIESGAPADVFFPADQDWMDYLQNRGLIRADSRRDVLGNRLVLVVPATSTLALRIGTGSALPAALGAGHWVTGDPDSVPVGRYARAALQRLGVWDALTPGLVRADNVRAALTLVARGEVAFGVVYATDAMIEPKVRVADVFPADLHPPIVYPIALTKGAVASAATFLTFVRGPEAAIVFRKFGFVTLNP